MMTMAVTPIATTKDLFANTANTKTMIEHWESGKAGPALLRPEREALLVHLWKRRNYADDGAKSQQDEKPKRDAW